ncbi:MAG: DUF2924 domain-containing protein [Acetobacteraceae bacterium]|nr:DUF2924 domain-containing protein [Acetobacteraceae bacterium]
MGGLEANNAGGATLSIPGMTCSGCANTLARILSRVPGVESANVEFDSGRAFVTGTADPKVMIRAVEAAGYEVLIVTDGSTQGFAWNGKTYPSLSAVAFAITGTKWNGYRFFGLRERSDRGVGQGRGGQGTAKADQPVRGHGPLALMPEEARP